nr:hypothetical protein [Tanacetum cinerariifolium]
MVCLLELFDDAMPKIRGRAQAITTWIWETDFPEQVVDSKNIVYEQLAIAMFVFTMFLDAAISLFTGPAIDIETPRIKRKCIHFASKTSQR